MTVKGEADEATDSAVLLHALRAQVARLTDRTQELKQARRRQLADARWHQAGG